MVGAGGKTTLLFSLAKFLPTEVLITTTTKLSSERTEGYPVLVANSESNTARQTELSPFNSQDPDQSTADFWYPAPCTSALRDKLSSAGRVIVFSAIRRGRGIGFPETQLQEWYQSRVAPHILCEADGARRMLAKAPAAHEPVIPECSTYVVVVIGALALGEPIERVCHRPELVAQLVGCDLNGIFTSQRAARLLRSKSGGLKGIPSAARTALLINQVTPDNETEAHRLGEITHSSFGQVLLNPMTLPVTAGEYQPGCPNPELGEAQPSDSPLPNSLQQGLAHQE